MNTLTARRATAGALVAFMALVIPAAPSFAETVVTETKAATAPAPGSAPTGIPQPKVTKDEALARLKQYFPVPQESATLNLEATLGNRGAHMTWEFMVTIHQGNGSMGTGLASVDATTGRILNYTGGNFAGTPIRIGPAGTARPEAEAREKAWKLIAEMYPDFASNLKPVDPKDQNPLYSYYYYGPGYATTDVYSFTWAMQVDGIPFPYGSISVSLDKETLAFTSMSANLPESMNFPPGPAKVDAKAAMDAWTFAGQPQLSYVPIMPKSMYGMYKPTGYNLAYTFRAGLPVDAMTGKLITDSMGYGQPTGTPEPVPAGDVKPVLPAATPLTDEEGYKLTLELFGLTDPTLIHPQPDMGGMGEEQLQYWLNDRDFSANVAFTKATGMIRYASRNNMAQPVSQGGADKVTPEKEAQAKVAAIAVVQKFYSQYLPELRMAPGSDPYLSRDNNMRRYTFTRYVNGALVTTDNIGVTIDLNTMQWRDMSCNWTTDVPFPSAERVISPAEAMIKFFAGKAARLIYQPAFSPVAPGPYEAPPAPTKAQLVYVLDIRPEASMINALTGEPMGYDGRPLSAMAEAMQKVQGHWAEGALRYLLTRQVFDLDTLNPDAPATRVQALQMLLQRDPHVYGRDPRPIALPFGDVKDGDPAYGAVLAAFKEGWLPSADAFRPEEKVTRAQFAVWAVRALGLGDLARSSLVITPVFSDMKGLTGEEVNAIHFLHYLGIVGAGDRFRPLDTLTQAEGAAITARIYNYLLGKRAQ